MNKTLEIISLIIRRWKSKSKKRNKITTNIALGLGIGLGILSFTPLGLPVWGVSLIGYSSTLAFLVSGGNKLTTENKDLQSETKKLLTKKKGDKVIQETK